ncbi:acetyl-CoA C-acetyltransferase [Vibrio natriegens]|uniref:Acetyl-CoA acetyltransferase n=1 Tax=Vibrio natriegens NBRC 15636 = ATCC 14048 = DSM 759 TaxID=1219067 RepID=A0AAN1CYY0_VIBNA|nr:acetyl-CoA C-acetyltransferase [Vibrio natriegens]CAH0526270.1 Acetyl-CoA acetyltransferase [Catenococcus thiocycli]ALR18861.1 acetyl-CoA acetyltransferase [Vibrio natriegens NBRC 15636 = ATCC 14048 = DSM 759]ANQ15695.1 acetyl-CoA acetyltransferase [Vibrio natriegens NBRC 15636 = ATCC 14048 = DSM 759]ANQ18999.1 acetyl-CoA acetyltransferase [Vibrio natriegens]MCY9875719.1 acetyl-CoA C-acetyltransferase [Vibrio natriegens]
MEKVYIVAAKRTPIGAFGGSLKNTSAGNLAAVAIKGALEAANLGSDKIDEVIVGNVVSAGQGMGVGRQAAIFAGIPESVPAYGVNMVCGSGMKTVMDAVSHIRSGDAQVVVAAGVEVMSQIPFIVPSSVRDGNKMGNMELKDLLITDGLTDIYNQYHMGVTAENVAKEVGISREQQDAYALASQQKAVAAIEAGKFKDEIVPVEVTQRRETIIFDTDEYPKANATLEGLSKLRPAFDREGTVTAGNASGINDGASAIIVASESAVQAHGLTPLAEVVSYAQSGIDPKIMGLGPVESVNKALKKAELNIQDIDVYELNEAFAAQALGVIHQLAETNQVPVSSIQDKANFNGGAIALGHPLGASGNRILVTLVHELHKQDAQYGVASLCVGGGMGTAVILKAIK